ncbi:hypothetical protein [Bacillus toyonensis]|nr:hypothetical protein [Bacillus toyonensis]
MYWIVSEDNISTADYLEGTERIHLKVKREDTYYELVTQIEMIILLF